MCFKDELQINLQACKRLANVLNKIANKDESETLYQVPFSFNDKPVVLERDLDMKLVLKIQKLIQVIYESGPVYVDDDDDEDSFKPADLNVIAYD